MSSIEQKIGIKYPTLYNTPHCYSPLLYNIDTDRADSRAKGVSLATVAFSLAGGAINEIVPYLINAIGFWVFILFALINFAMIVPIWLFYIGKFEVSPPLLSSTLTNYATETANRHLEDLDLLFAGKSNLSWRAEREFALIKSREAMAHEEGNQEKSDGVAC